MAMLVAPSPPGAIPGGPCPALCSRTNCPGGAVAGKGPAGAGRQMLWWPGCWAGGPGLRGHPSSATPHAEYPQPPHAHRAGSSMLCPGEEPQATLTLTKSWIWGFSAMLGGGCRLSGGCAVSACAGATAPPSPHSSLGCTRSHPRLAPQHSRGRPTVGPQLLLLLPAQVQARAARSIARCSSSCLGALLAPCTALRPQPASLPTLKDAKRWVWLCVVPSSLCP